MSRQDELKKTLQQLKDGTIDAAAASQQLEGMFKQIESDMGKIKDASGAPGEGLETAIKIQYVGMADALNAAGEESFKSFTRIFGNYKALLNDQVMKTVDGAAKLNKMLSKSGENLIRTFNDYKGMSLQATNETAGLMSRSVDSLLKTMTMDEIKPFLVSTTAAFKENFKAIAFEVPEVEAKYIKLAAAFQAMGVNARESATYFQDLKNVGRMSADEVGVAGLEIQKIAEITNGDFKTMMANFHKLVVEQGYDKKEAIANLKEMQLQTMKTGVSFDSLSGIFGKGLDNFSQIAPKVAELNSVFKLRLNPAAMTRMTAKERAQYVTNALKNSNVDLNSRLLQRQLSSVFGSEEAARKYLSSIRNTNAATSEAIDATRKKLDAVGSETVSGAKALEGLQKIAVDQMDPSRALALKQQEAAAQAQIAAAGGRDEKGNLKLEDKAMASYNARLAAQNKLFSEMQTQGGKYIQQMVVDFQMMQAEIGKGPFKNVNLGTIVAGAGTASALMQDMSAKMREANATALANINKELAETQDPAEKKTLEARKKKLEEASAALEAQAKSDLPEKLKNMPQKTFERIKNFLSSNMAQPDEAPGDQVARLKKEAKAAGGAVLDSGSKAVDTVANSVDDLVRAIKAMPIVLQVNGKELTRVVLETSTGTR